jgi:hypothetical protein
LSDKQRFKQQERPHEGPLRSLSATKAVTGHDRSIAFDVVRSNVIEEATSSTDQLQQAAPGVMILLVHSEMFVQMVDALGEQCHLHLGRTRVGLVELVLSDDPGLGCVYLI